MEIQNHMQWNETNNYDPWPDEIYGKIVVKLRGGALISFTSPRAACISILGVIGNFKHRSRHCSIRDVFFPVCENESVLCLWKVLKMLPRNVCTVERQSVKWRRVFDSQVSATLEKTEHEVDVKRFKSSKSIYNLLKTPFENKCLCRPNVFS